MIEDVTPKRLLMNEEQKLAEDMADRRLQLLRYLIDLSYTYKSDKVLFYKKFVETINIHELKRWQVVDTSVPEALAQSTQLAYEESCLRTKDIDLYRLLEAGFTPRELSIIYNLNNTHSIYVKCCRLRAKLKALENDSLILEKAKA